jgi:hypothetical protein
LEYRNIGAAEKWYSGTVVQWYSGTVVQWYSGTVVQGGTVEQGRSGAVKG